MTIDTKDALPIALQTAVTKRFDLLGMISALYARLCGKGLKVWLNVEESEILGELTWFRCF